MLPHSSSGASIHDLMRDPAALSDFDHIFSDQELASFLDSVAQGEGLALPGDQQHAAPGGQCFPLQFLPPDAPEDQCTAPAVTSAMSSYDELPPSQHAQPPAGIQAPAPPPLSSATSATDQQHNAIGILAQGANSAIDLRALQTLLAGHQSATASLAPPPPPTSATSSSLLRGQTVPVPLSSNSRAAAKAAMDNKPQISHSTVEKQRRDRINALIDELRELVPPSKAGQAAAAAAGGGSKDNMSNEARRPKHVVLADTIALLKQLQLRGPLASFLAAPCGMVGGSGAGPCSGSGGEGTVQHGRSGSGEVVNMQCMAPAGPPVKEERASPTNSNSKGSVSSRGDVEMKDEARTAAPKLPHIPIQPTLLAGVVVESGPDCMYVQVRCRDRKGLLLDIINALRNMPLEIRTAAVTTQPDGQVRDVFEVCVDDKSLQPEDIQNMVHEALFQQYHLSAEAHKRARAGN